MDRTGRMRLHGHRVLLSAGIALVLLLSAASSAMAAPACTIIWDGSAGTGSWSTATNWDLNRVPVTTDHVCILPSPTPVTVVLPSDTTSIRSVQAWQPLSIGGTSALDLTDSAEISSIADATLLGTLTGQGAVDITGTLTWGDSGPSGPAMTGSGITTVRPGAILNIGSRYAVHLGGTRVLRNDGTINWTAGVIYGYKPGGA